MMIILRLLINALTLLLITRLIDGFTVDSFYYALIAAVVLGLINAIIRPIIHFFTFPITILTLGLFSLVINAALIWFASSFLDGFTVEGFLPAIFAAIILWIVSTLTNIFLKSE